MDGLDRGGYAKYVEDKVYKPFNSSLSSSLLEKRVEKLESEKIQTDKIIHELTSIIDSIKFDNKENISTNYQNGYMQKNTFEQRIEKLEKRRAKNLWANNSFQIWIWA